MYQDNEIIQKRKGKKDIIECKKKLQVLDVFTVLAIKINF
jgi:hypothetical protein